jgi:hypothetical protein
VLSPTTPATIHHILQHSHPGPYLRLATLLNQV